MGAGSQEMHPRRLNWCLSLGFMHWDGSSFQWVGVRCGQLRGSTGALCIVPMVRLFILIYTVDISGIYKAQRQCITNFPEFMRLETRTAGKKFCIYKNMSGSRPLLLVRSIFDSIDLQGNERVYVRHTARLPEVRVTSGSQHMQSISR
jgi:hypothetical protein